MVELLDHAVSDGALDELSPMMAAGPPKAMPDIERSVEPRWPRRARFVVAVLAVLAVAGAFGTAWLYHDDDATIGDQARVTEPTDQRDVLLVQNGNLRNDIERLEADNAQLEADNAQLVTDNAQLVTDNAQLATDNAAVSTQLAAVQADSSAMSEQLDSATAEVDDLTAQVGELQAANDTVTAEHDALTVMFPMLLNTSLVGVDVTGTYAVKWFPAYDFRLPDVLFPRVPQITLSPTPDGWVQITIPGILTAGLFGTDGALSTIVDTTAALPPINDMPRTARLTITIYAGATVTGSDGTTIVTELGMSIAVTAPRVGDAPAGVALYGAVLTRS